MRELSDEEKAAVVRFVTGSSQVPVEGFKGLRGRKSRNEQGTEKFKIQRVRPPPTATCKEECRRTRPQACVCRLPQSHTCFNTLDLPPYPTKAILKDKLMTAVTAGAGGFGFA
jgi:E3 ubiquitin-protein ligase HUWE1